MDIIRLGDLSISNFNNDTVVTFRMPSSKRTDYVDESKTPFKGEVKPGRNSPCPCGSGKKYKQCCGKY